MAETAELFVIDQLVNGWMIAAHGAVRITAQLQCVDLHRHGIETDETADQAVAFAENQLNRFQRFDDPDQIRVDTPSTPASAQLGAISAGGGSG